MKKIVLAVLIIIIGLFISIIIISNSKNITSNLIIYSIPESSIYKYEQSKRISIELYVNEKDSLIMYPDDNKYTISNNTYCYDLQNVNVECKFNSIIENDHYYKYIIYFDILPFQSKNIILKDCYLTIENELFQIKSYIGSILIYTEQIDSLKYYDLYGNYCYLDNGLLLVGISIELDDEYQIINQVNLLEGYGCLNKIESDVIYSSEINRSELKHEIINEIEGSNYVINSYSRLLFIPISYNEYFYIDKTGIIFEIDNKLFLLEDFTYVFSDALLNNYLKFAKKGEFKYVKA